MKRNAWQRMIHPLAGPMMHYLPGVITCAEFDAFLTDYLEGTLPKKNARRMAQHLVLCSGCRAYLEEYRRTIAAGRAAFADPEAPVTETAVPPDLVEAVLAARRR